MRTFGLSERTNTVNDCVALKFGEPLSVTTTLKKFDVPELFVVVSHETTPVLVLIVAPAGAAGRLKMSCCAGTSVSFAKLVTERVSPPLRTRLVNGDKVGGVLVALACRLTAQRNAATNKTHLFKDLAINYLVALIR